MLCQPRVLASALVNLGMNQFGILLKDTTGDGFSRGHALP